MKEEVFNCLKYGKENAISRSELCLRLGYSDRDVRRAIELLRADGWCILSSSHYNGYFLPSESEIELVELYIKEMKSRIKKITTSLKPAEIWIKNNNDPNQLKFDNVL